MLRSLSTAGAAVGQMRMNSMDAGSDETIPAFSATLEQALRELVTSADPLDSEDFDPIEHINEVFPDEDSLADGKLEVYLRDLRGNVVTLSDGIQRDVREFSSQRSRTTKSVEKSTRALEELFDKIRAIQSKASASEVMVQDICRDIKSLDYAKKNLTASIVALKNLHMLVSLIEQLERVSDKKSYREATGLLCAINDLLASFGSYSDVPKMTALSDQVQRTKDELKTQLFAELKQGLPSLPSASEETQNTLKEACQVLDVMSPTVKTEFLAWFTKKQMEVYVAGFAPGEDGGTLANAERRYPYLRRLLREFEDTFKEIFPSKWNVPALLAKEFCLLTYTHLKILLKNDNTDDVASLIRAMTRTAEAERELSVRFKLSSYDDAVKDYEERDLDDEAAAIGVVEAIRQKHKERDAPASFETPMIDFKFDRSISEVFTPYMSTYVQHERSSMESLIQSVTKEEKWVLEEGDDRDVDEDKTLKGCDDLFLYIKASVKRCTKLTKGDTLFKLYQEYEKMLLMYVELLRSRLPSSSVSDADNSASAKSEKEPVPLNRTELGSLCLIVNTAEYCASSMTALAESVRKNIEEPYLDSVDLSQVESSFLALLNQAIEAIASGICAKLGKALKDMTKLPWTTWEMVGDQSEYVSQIEGIFLQDLPILQKLLSDVHHGLLCARLVSIFVPKLLEAIYKTRRIGDLGAQQLLLDSQALKSILLKVPLIEETVECDVDEAGRSRPKPSKRKAPRVFSRRVKKEMATVEAVLKTLGSPGEGMIMTLKTVMPVFTPQDLTKIMNLKGLKRSEQQALVDAYNSSQEDPSEHVTLAVNTTTDIRKLFKIY